MKKTSDKIIKITPQEYSELERALQWPEDLKKYDQINKPTNLTELSFITTEEL